MKAMARVFEHHVFKSEASMNTASRDFRGPGIIDRLRTSTTLGRAGFLVLFGLLWFRVGEGRTASTGKVVEAEAFVLRGPDGVKRGEFSIDKEGSTVLSIMDAKGKPRIELITGDTAAGIRLYDGAGEGRLDLRVENDAKKGLTSIQLYDPKDVSRLQLESSIDGVAAVTVFDKTTQKTRLRMGASNQGNPWVAANDADGKNRIQLRILSDQTALVGVGGEGESATKLVTRPDGTAGLEIYDTDGKIRMFQYFQAGPDSTTFGMRNAGRPENQIGLGVVPDGRASLFIYDKDQKRAIRLSAFPDTGPELSLHGDDTRPRAVLDLDGDDLARARLIDKHGKFIGFAGAVKE